MQEKRVNHTEGKAGGPRREWQRECSWLGTIFYYTFWFNTVVLKPRGFNTLLSTLYTDSVPCDFQGF